MTVLKFAKTSVVGGGYEGHHSLYIAGGRSSGRWIGMAPDAKLAVAIALDGEQGGTDAQVLAGIDWAVDRGVDVLNMSLGGLTLGPEVPSTCTEAILTSLRAGIPVVTAIGNDGQQITGSPGNDLLSFSVGATDYRDCEELQRMASEKLVERFQYNVAIRHRSIVH